jgi:hypothetical protein
MQSQKQLSQYCAEETEENLPMSATVNAAIVSANLEPAEEEAAAAAAEDED